MFFRRRKTRIEIEQTTLTVQRYDRPTAVAMPPEPAPAPATLPGSSPATALNVSAEDRPPPILL